MKILVGSEKGGTGKTTIATNLATTLASRGRDVVLLDTDRQASAAFWCAERKHRETTATVHCLERHGDVFDTIVDLEERYQDVIIDAGGRDSEELRSAMLGVNLLLSPFRASQFDLWTAEHLSALVSKARNWNRGLVALAVLNMVPTHARASEPEEARQMLGDFPVLRMASSVVFDRKAFRDAACQGLGVIEHSDPKAATEILSLTDEVTHVEVQQTAAAH